MKKIEKLLLLSAFICLFVIRFVNLFPWVSSLAVAGVFLSVLDIISHIWHDNPSSKIKKNEIYILCLLTSIIIEIILIVLMIINIVSPRSWMENSLFIDEVTIIALMLGVFQSSIISIINFIIQGKN